ncbi:uncharacterized protein B0H18DRAFT_592728 [Fomitopsis serialis]|uniref:uncharacterized protein n=1 Tax=Fomitopsis serialis TaxID=139415 RepID=UPI002008BC28|nr:uncharacterized protein B0H18DRAFT_592728 [Neoantrodia serialis]KAH9920440.1 hypothetical protein B0H18DRAFT_592728 [Neoantrodia serialis]
MSPSRKPYTHTHPSNPPRTPATPLSTFSVPHTAPTALALTTSLLSTSLSRADCKKHIAVLASPPRSARSRRTPSSPGSTLARGGAASRAPPCSSRAGPSCTSRRCSGPFRATGTRRTGISGGRRGCSLRWWGCSCLSRSALLSGMTTGTVRSLRVLRACQALAYCVRERWHNADLALRSPTIRVGRLVRESAFRAPCVDFPPMQ